MKYCARPVVQALDHERRSGGEQELFLAPVDDDSMSFLCRLKVCLVVVGDLFVGLVYGVLYRLKGSDLDAEHVEKVKTLFSLIDLKPVPVAQEAHASGQRKLLEAGEHHVARDPFVGGRDVREQGKPRARVPRSGVHAGVRHGVEPHAVERPVGVVGSAKVSVGRSVDERGVLGFTSAEGLVHYVPDSLGVGAEARPEQLGSRNPRPVKSGLIDDVVLIALYEVVEVSAPELLDVSALEHLRQPSVLGGNVQRVDDNSALRGPEWVAILVLVLEVYFYAQGHERPVGDRHVFPGQPKHSRTASDLMRGSKQGAIHHIENRVPLRSLTGDMDQAG